MVMYLIAGKLGANPRRALITTLAVGLGTMLWPYSAVYYGHVMAATFLIIAFYLLLLMRDGPQAMQWLEICGRRRRDGIRIYHRVHVWVDHRRSSACMQPMS